jgi:hypothetical protein
MDYPLIVLHTDAVVNTTPVTEEDVSTITMEHHSV